MQSTTALPMSLTLPVPSAGGSIEAYVQAVNRIPMLSPERERSLALRLRDQNDLEAARFEFICDSSRKAVLWSGERQINPLCFRQVSKGGYFLRPDVNAFREFCDPCVPFRAEDLLHPGTSGKGPHQSVFPSARTNYISNHQNSHCYSTNQDQVPGLTSSVQRPEYSPGIQTRNGGALPYGLRHSLRHLLSPSNCTTWLFRSTGTLE